MNPTDGAAAFDVSENGTLAYLPVSSYITETRPGAGGPAGPRDPRAARQRPLQPPPPLARREPHRGRYPLGQLDGRRLGLSRWAAPAGSGSPPKAARDFGAEWTPDGRELIYISERPYFDLYRRAADASRPPLPLVTGGHDHYPGWVSADGRLLRLHAQHVRRDRALDRRRCRASPAPEAISLRTASTWRTRPSRPTAAGWPTTRTSRDGSRCTCSPSRSRPAALEGVAGLRVGAAVDPGRPRAGLSQGATA